MIADGYPVSISAEVAKDSLNTVKGRFAIDDPLLMVELSTESFESMRCAEMTDTTWKSQGS